MGSHIELFWTAKNSCVQYISALLHSYQMVCFQHFLLHRKGHFIVRLNLVQANYANECKSRKSCSELVRSEIYKWAHFCLLSDQNEVGHGLEPEADHSSTSLARTGDLFFWLHKLLNLRSATKQHSNKCPKQKWADGKSISWGS